ncbi:MAG TPA: glycosyltransferase [Waterburya sp.]|jgi:glycosyltransferase involved in cell wall biosynthesis
MPTISVVIPTYNAERTILDTVASVQQQTFSDFEIIVIDDGSKDQTLERLNTIKDPRLKVFPYENGGVSVARNRGLAQATGEYISFLDHDDLWTPDKLELQLAALQENPEAGVAYSWTYKMIETGDSFSPAKKVFFQGNVYPDLLVYNFIDNGSNILIRKQALESAGGFNPTLAYCADWDFYLRLATHWPFVLVPKPQVFYRQSSGSMSSKITLLENESLALVEKAFEEAPRELQRLKNQSLANVYRYCGKLYLQRGTHKAGGINNAIQRFWIASYLYPQWFIKKMLPPHLFDKPTVSSPLS